MIHVGILGCGAIARKRHIVECSRHPGVEIAGVYDISEERSDELAKAYNIKAYKSMEEMIADPQVDAVIVCVANSSHAEYTIKALEAGKHVLCEKPMATTPEECEEMVSAAQKSGKRLSIAQNQRLSPAHVHAKRVLKSSELGKVISFQSTFGHKGPEMWSMDRSADTWFFKKESAVFGSMADLGIHKLDLILYLLDDKVTSAYANLLTLDKKFPDGKPIEVDDNSVMFLTFEKGTVGTVTTSWTHYGEECNATVLYCEKGIIRMYADPKYTLQIIYADGTKVNYELASMQTNNDDQQTSSGVIDTFVEGLKTNAPTVLDADRIIESMRVVFACLESSKNGKAVML
jgi:predicted dehydrogenase